MKVSTYFKKRPAIAALSLLMLLITILSAASSTFLTSRTWSTTTDFQNGTIWYNTTQANNRVQLNSTTLVNGLIAYWKFNSNSVDSKGTNTGADTGVVYLPAGKIAGSSYFDGLTSFSNVGDGFQTAYTAFSFGGWVNATSNAGDNHFVFDGHNGGNQGFFLRTDTGETTITCEMGTGSSEETITTSTRLGQWDHYLCTWDGTTFKMFANGGLVGSTPVSAYSPNTGHTDFGAYPGLDLLFFQGGIDEFGFWNRALTTGEIVTLLNTTKNLNRTGITYPFTNWQGELKDLQGWSASSGGTIINATIVTNTSANADCQFSYSNDNVTFSAWTNLSVNGSNTVVTSSMGLGQSIFYKFNLTNDAVRGDACQVTSWTLNEVAPPVAPTGAVYTIGPDVTTNSTPREASSPKFNFTIIYNATKVASINISMVYDSVVQSESHGTWAWNATYTAVTYNSSFPLPLVAADGTTTGWNYAWAIGLTNGTRATGSTPGGTDTVGWAAAVTGVSVAGTLPGNNIIEGSTANFNSTNSLLEPNLNTLTNFSYNTTLVVGSILLNSSTSQTWSGSLTLPQSVVNNFTATINSTLVVNFRNLTSVRTGTFSVGQIVWKIIVTDCSSTSVSTNRSINYSIVSQNDPNIPVTINSVDQHTVSFNGGTARVYSFSRAAASNWSICLYPYYFGVAVQDAQVVQVGDGITFGLQSVIRTDTINASNALPVTIYALNLTAANVQLVTINVQDANANNLQNIALETYRYYPATNTNLLIGSDVTDFSGIIKESLVMNDVYYNFKIYSDAARSNLLASTPNMHIFSNPTVLKVGTAVPKLVVLYSYISKGKAEITHLNSTQQFQLKYDVSEVLKSNATFTINSVCLRTYYALNGTSSNFTSYDLTCSAATGGTITGAATSEAISTDWKAVAFLNISSSPAEEYPVISLAFSYLSPLGATGLFWVVFTAIAVSVVGLWNPVVFMVTFTASLSILAWAGLISGFVPIIVVIIAFVLIYMRQTRA